MAHVIIGEGIKQKIAEKVTEQASAGYSAEAQGEWFVVNGSAVVHKQSNAPWVPWYDGDAVISVEDLVFWAGGADADRADFENGVDGAEDFDLTVDFALGYVPDSYDAAAWEAKTADEYGY